MDYIVAPQWHGANKKGPEIGAQRIAELFKRRRNRINQTTHPGGRQRR